MSLVEKAHGGNQTDSFAGRGDLSRGSLHLLYGTDDFHMDQDNDYLRSVQVWLLLWRFCLADIHKNPEKDQRKVTKNLRKSWTFLLECRY
jgi:hypothetical protein